jgi:hypothetical protein
MSEHIFEILGIRSREDSYTDLIAYAFNNNFEFKKNFLLHILEENQPSDWEKPIVRPSVFIKKSSRTKDMPDLILINKKIPKVILIENKIFSDEGWEQTKHYASHEFKQALVEYLKKNNMLLNDDQIQFVYYFLTLEGKKAAAEKFRPLSYCRILEILNDIKFGNSKLDILLQELKERLEEYYQWPCPVETDNVFSYLNKTKRLVNQYRTFQILMKTLLADKKEFEKWGGITSNRGCGYIPLYLFYKPSWVGREYSKETDGFECYHIHFELQWNTRWNELTLYLHYETNPYMTKAEYYKVIDEQFKIRYRTRREEFVSFLKEHMNRINNWQICKNKWLMVAKYRFKEDDVIFLNFKNKFNALVNSMEDIVDDYYSR